MKFELAKGDPRPSMVQRMIWGVIRLIAVEILAPVSGRGLEQEEWRGVITVKLWRIETQDWAFLLVFHDVMVFTFKFGGNRRFFGVDTADFVWCRGGTRAIRLPVVCDIPVSDIN